MEVAGPEKELELIGTQDATHLKSLGMFFIVY